MSLLKIIKETLAIHDYLHAKLIRIRNETNR